MLKHVSRLFVGPTHRISGQLVKAGSVGAADQLIISGVNFLLMIAAARALGPSSFGVFAVVYLVLTSTQPIQESLVTAPFNVFIVGKTGTEYRRYLTSVALFQILLALVIGAFIAAPAIIFLTFNPSIGWMVLTMAAAASAWQFQEFIRRVLYAESRFSEVLLNDTITHGIRLIVLVALFSSNGLTASYLFVLLAGTWTVGGLLGVWQIRRGLIRSMRLSSLRAVGAEHWAFGRWLIITTGISYIPWYVTTVVMTASLSTAAYGAFRAFEQLVNAANVPLQTIYNLVRPRLARDARDGHQTMWRTMTPIMLIGGVGFAVFGLGLMLSQEFLFSLFFGSEYVPFTPAMFLLALTPLVLLQKTVLSLGLQALRVTRPIFVAEIIGACVRCVVSFIVIPTFGLQAAGAPEVMGFGTAGVYLAWIWKKHNTARRSEPTSLQAQVSLYSSPDQASSDLAVTKPDMTNHVVKMCGTKISRNKDTQRMAEN